MTAPDLAAWLWRDAAAPVRRFVGNFDDGRACAPEETLERVLPLLRRHGVTRLGRLTGLDRIGIPVWNAVRPNSLTIVISQGKGVTDAHAQVSAAMEAIERAVAGDPAIPLRTAATSSLRAAGERPLRLGRLLARGASEIAEDELIAWARGFDLVHGSEVWVPVEAAMLDRTAPSRFWQSSDGLASGNTLLEAVLHALLERIERDAEVLWKLSSAGRHHAACVEPQSLGDPTLDGLCARIAGAGLLLRLFDMTSDVGIPAFTALLAEPNAADPARTARFVEVANGSGAHPLPARAAIRAVTEAAQSRLTYISGARDDIPREHFLRELPRTIREDLGAVPRPFRGAKPIEAASLGAMLAAVVERLGNVGANTVVAVPLLGQDEAIAVAKVFAPDLEHPDGARRTKLGRRAVAHMLAG